MTIDITIGKLKIKSLNQFLSETLNENWTTTHKHTISAVELLEVEQCPDEPDGCTKEDTAWPNSAYRSGSIGGMWDFFDKVMPELIGMIKTVSTNDKQITKIKPFIIEINNLEYNGTEEQHRKRLHWFKFWCNRALELYGEEAVIEFT